MAKYVNIDELRTEFWTPDDKEYSYEDICKILDEMQSTDVVEVVWCKDCKNSVCIGERYFCDIQYDEWGQPYVVKPDGFCDVGERKETE